MITMMTTTHTLINKVMLMTMTKTKRKSNKTTNVDSNAKEFNNNQPDDPVVASTMQSNDHWDGSNNDVKMIGCYRLIVVVVACIGYFIIILINAN